MDHTLPQCGPLLHSWPWSWSLYQYFRHTMVPRRRARSICPRRYPAPCVVLPWSVHSSYEQNVSNIHHEAAGPRFNCCPFTICSHYLQTIKVECVEKGEKVLISMVRRGHNFAVFYPCVRGWCAVPRRIMHQSKCCTWTVSEYIIKCMFINIQSKGS